MTNQELKAYLKELPWTELKRKAAVEYGIKVLPEYKQENIIALILDLNAQPTKFVTDQEPIADKPDKSGWSRIKVIKSGREKDTHCRGCHNGYQFAIPFNVEINFPTVTAEYLETKKQPVYKEESNAGDLLGGLYDGSGLENRWTVVFLEKNNGPNGERGFIPKSERGKYWTTTREAKLAPKRAFYDQFGFWPTDKKLQEYMTAGMFTHLRRQNNIVG